MKNDKVSKPEIMRTVSSEPHRYMVITIYTRKVEASSFLSGGITLIAQLIL